MSAAHRQVLKRCRQTRVRVLVTVEYVLMFAARCKKMPSTPGVFLLSVKVIIFTRVCLAFYAVCAFDPVDPVCSVPYRNFYEGQ